MAQIRPFSAVIPGEGKASVVSSLPNDVFSEEEARRVTERNPLSFLSVVRPETQFPVGQDPYADVVYEKAGELLRERVLSGDLIQRPEKAFYVYRLIREGHSQTGIVGLSSVDDYLNGVCKKHEHTVKKKETDRARHIAACRAQTGPIFIAFRPDEAIRAVTAQIRETHPIFDFTSEDGVRHTVWECSDPVVCESITSLFQRVPFTYIADGHHRTAAAVRYALDQRETDPSFTGEEEYNWFLSVLFPADELRILEYNRVVYDLNGYSCDTFLEKLKEFVELSPLPSASVPRKRGSVSMYLRGKWFALSFKEEVLSRKRSTVEALDVSLLQDLILSPILGIEDPRASSRIEFLGGIRGLDELERIADRYDDAVAFAMFPTSLDDLMAIADSGEVMPPKSTWFEPKLRSGLFVHML